MRFVGGVRIAQSGTSRNFSGSGAGADGVAEGTTAGVAAGGAAGFDGAGAADVVLIPNENGLAGGVG